MRQFNTSSLTIETSREAKRLLLPQKRLSKNEFYMNTLIDGRDYDWFLTREQIEALHSHLGGMLGKEADGH